MAKTKSNKGAGGSNEAPPAIDATESEEVSASSSPELAPPELPDGSHVVLGTDESESEDGVVHVSPQGEVKKVHGFNVSAPSGSFWRCGIHFTKEPRFIEQHELKLEQLTRILGEPMLKHEIVEK